MSRDWNEDMETALKPGYAKQQIAVYWLNESKRLAEDNARWACQYTAAEQKYQTQSNVIAELRNIAEKAEAEADKWRIEAFRKYPTPEAYEATCSALEKHRERADKAEEREQKLREAVEKEIEYYGDLYDGRGMNLRKLLSTIYTLDREDTTNGTDD